ncbi:MAG TPA: FAD-dependent oxidoreductase [Acidimicrobiales bacterium]|nr:FAD-dependent oxidoreductase [Acidimicrobiales bacterium]
MPTAKLDVDVCVVGAGFAGLTTARMLVAEGYTVAVLEARDRVGGRTWSDSAAGGLAIDRGGAWLSPRHTAALALAAELGVPTYKTYVAGSHLLVSEGRMQRYKGLIPRISPLALIQIAATQWRVDRMARQVPVDEPWSAPRAAEWDADSVGDWLSRVRIRSDVGRDLFSMAVRGLFAATDMRDVSLLHLLFLVRAHEKIEDLFSIEGGAQENLVEGGLAGLAVRMAADLGEAVRLGAAVRSITQTGDGVAVGAEGHEVSARCAVVAIPPALALGIDFDPILPADRQDLYAAAVGGVESKTLVVYETPFWREEGLSGQTAAAGSASEVTIDSSPSDGSRGVLASFTFGAVAERMDALPQEQRRAAVLEALAQRFGPRAATPLDFVETPWWQEPWSRGCSFAHLPPGMLTRHGHLLRQPFGRVHWAGTETATVSHGAVDGAIRSGQRAAREVLPVLEVLAPSR